MPSMRLREISLIDGWLQANVFARRHQDRRIVFENQAVRRYAQDMHLENAANTQESTLCYQTLEPRDESQHSASPVS